MFELTLCSIFTILPDYIYRRYVQGKRFGHEINLFSVWYELRWGITGCLILTVLLITTIFYFHPSTTNAISFYRTVPVLPETSGRVEDVFVKLGDKVKAGQPIFRLESSKQKAALDTAKRRVAEVDASIEQAKADAQSAKGGVVEAESRLQQARDDLERKRLLNKRNSGIVALREIERLQNIVASREGALARALANLKSTTTRVTLLLPAQKASALAERKQAQVELDKMTVYAGVDGTMEQFALRKGDVVNPIMRPAGILVPADAGRRGFIAGFGQIEAQVLKVGMAAEVTCPAKPLTVIPAVVTNIQSVVASGQVRPTDQLLDAAQIKQPGTISVILEPLYKDGFKGVPAGSQCIANAYTSNHDRLSTPGLGVGEWLLLHAIDTIGVVHAIIIRIQALVLPIKTLVLTGH